jgi:hypothetical protein
LFDTIHAFAAAEAPGAVNRAIVMLKRITIIGTLSMAGVRRVALLLNKERVELGALPLAEVIEDSLVDSISSFDIMPALI